MTCGHYYRSVLLSTIFYLCITRNNGNIEWCVNRFPQILFLLSISLSLFQDINISFSTGIQLLAAVVSRTFILRLANGKHSFDKLVQHQSWSKSISSYTNFLCNMFLVLVYVLQEAIFPQASKTAAKREQTKFYYQANKMAL